jgi:hypothetical protein
MPTSKSYRINYHAFLNRFFDYELLYQRNIQNDGNQDELNSLFLIIKPIQCSFHIVVYLLKARTMKAEKEPLLCNVRT